MYNLKISLYPLLLSSTLLGLLACSNHPLQQANHQQVLDLNTAHLPKIAAEYSTTRTDKHVTDEHAEVAATPVVWRFWRDDQQIVIERPQLGLGELWQRDGKTLIHRKLYHTDQRAIEFQEDDLRMLGNSPTWQKLTLLVDPKLLTKLTASDVQWLDGHPVRDYQGHIGAAQWHIVMRMDQGIASLIEHQQNGVLEHTQLLNAYQLKQAPWQPTPTQSYEVIDYADLGDKEYDPFVIKAQAQMGHSHSH